MDDSINPKAAKVPLCVDLDGTLIRSDLLFESALALLKLNPLYLLAFPLWLIHGRAHLKREIARRVHVDVTSLPYDRRTMALVAGERGHRPLVLCTAADRSLAEAVAAHVGGFDATLASDGRRNLSGRRKAEALVDLYGEGGFDYAGNASRDLWIWRHARSAFVVNAGKRLGARAAKICDLSAVLPREQARGPAWLKAIRPHQWLKNALVFVPLLAAHLVLEPVALARSCAAFVVFCLCATSVYLLNDLLDLEADRLHPRKRKRPFASGELSLSSGLIAAPLLTACAFIAAYELATSFALVLGCYYVLTLAYSLKLKQIAMLDVLVLAALYTIRIIAGTTAISVGFSFWLLAFSMFLFLSLALVKRYTELGVQRKAGNKNVHGRGYATSDYELLAALGGASGYLSVLVLALYINSTASALHYHRPEFLWLLCPLLLYWISRVWIVAHRGAMHDDPIVFAARDRVSFAVLLLAAAVILLAIW